MFFLIILPLFAQDSMMPVMTGDTALVQLRQRDVATPVIMVTANAMNEQREGYLALGAQAVVTKPWTFQGLMAAIEEVRRHCVPPLRCDKLIR